MKKPALLLAALAAVLIIASCALEAPSQGHVTISVPRSLITQSAAARSVTLGTGASAQTVDAIRLYISLNGSYLKQAGGANYSQFDLSASAAGASDANTITLDLPPTSGYKILAALGTTTGGWKTVYFGETQAFTVSAGVFTQQSLPIQSLAQVAQTTTATTSRTARAGAASYWIEGSNLKGSDGTSVALGSLVASSLSNGIWFNGSGGYREELWLNTNQGIYRLDPGHASLSAVSDSGFGANALGSGAMVATINSSSTLLVYYFAGGKDFGIRYSSASASTSTNGSNWTGFRLLDSIQGTSYEDLVNKISKDIVVSIVQSGGVNGVSDYFYASTALGLLELGKGEITNAGTDFEKWFTNILSGASSTVTIKSGNTAVTVGQLALDGAASSTVYAGTDLGLWAVPVTNAATGAAGTPALVGLSGQTVSEIAALADGTASYAAALDDLGNVYVFKNKAQISFSATGSGNLAWDHIPFYAGLPSNPNSLSLYVNGTNIELRVAGDDGFSVVTVGKSGS